MDSLNDASKFGGDAWSELQAFKTRQINRREKLNRHKDLLNGLASTAQTFPRSLLTASTSSSSSVCPSANTDDSRTQDNINQQAFNGGDVAPYHDNHLTNAKDSATTNNLPSETVSDPHHSPIGKISSSSIRTNAERSHLDPESVECLLILKLCDVALKLPIDSESLKRSICKISGLENTSRLTIENFLEKFAHQELITIQGPSAAILNKLRKNNRTDNDHDEETCIYVISADHTKLVEFDKTFGSLNNIRALLSESKSDSSRDELNSISTHNTVPIQNIRSTSDQNHGLDIFKSSIKQNDTNGIGSRQNNTEHQRISSIESKRSLLGDDVESLLSLSSTRERESKKLGEELLELLSKPTAKERNLLESFRSADGYQVQEFCFKGTKDECRRYKREAEACDKLHFKKIIAKHTEESLGDCSFLNTCFHMDSCKYVHYEVDYDNNEQSKKNQHLRNQSSNRRKLKNESKIGNQQQPAIAEKTKKIKSSTKDKIQDAKQPATPVLPSQDYILTVEEKARIDLRNQKRFKTVLSPPQWIQCDLRYFDMSLLGKFSVIMADPPWDIHMELPYGTMSDDEMRKLNIPTLQDEGLIFLWVTGRAMELGRECLALWGYERCDEIIWVKTNQLQRIIRTGRTGHWLNHGKEHCLVGIKGNPTDINLGLDCDIIVAEVRATSHKPDEIYGIIERLSPGTRKIELFGRSHNVQPNWITLGNQLNGVNLVEPDLVENFKRVNLPYQTSEPIT